MRTARVWRIAAARHASFDGEGTRRYGSRWVPRGLAAVYTSGSLSLAALELFVHTNPDLLPAGLQAVAADIPDSLTIETIDVSELPSNWQEVPAPYELQDYGREWIAEGRTAVLSVPSVVIPTERNYILNPGHRSFRRIRIGKPRAFSFDPRMWSR